MCEILAAERPMMSPASPPGSFYFRCSFLECAVLDCSRDVKVKIFTDRLPHFGMGVPPPSNYWSDPASFFRKKYTLSSTGINSNKHPPIASDAKVARLRFPSSSISPKAYWSSIGEKRSLASLLVIQPGSSNGSILIDAASSALLLPSSRRADGASIDP
jgi:hypothetical protein